MKHSLARLWMKPGVLFSGTVPAVILLSSQLLAAEDFEPPTLRHRFEAGSTNVFKLNLEMQTEDGKSVLQGNLVVVTTTADKNTATVTFETKLRPPTTPIRPGPFYGPNGPIWNPFEFRGFGYGMPLISQVELDSQGRVLRSMGELALAPPFNELYRILFPRFPDQPARQWTFQSEQNLPADSWGGNRRFPGYYPPMGPGSRAPAQMTVTRRENCQVASIKDEVARIRQELLIESWARLEDTPRWRISGNADIDFDTAKGRLVSVALPCTAVWTSETTIRRAPMVLRCERVAESELKDILVALKPEMPANLNEEELRKLLQDLDATEPEKKSKAVNTLMTANVTSVGPDTLAMLEEKAKTAETYVRNGLVRILAQNATSAQVPWLLGLMRSSDLSVRTEAAKALGRLKEKRAAEPLADMIAQGNYDQSASESLKQIGPAAEEAVLMLLREKHQETRRRACEILQQIGTSRSLEPLRGILLSVDESVAMAVRQAIQEIQSRLTMIEAGSR